VKTVGPVCKRFAAILGGTPQIVNGVCTVTRIIPHHVTIEGRRSKSPLTLAALFSFESIDKNGRALNLGETHILQKDVNRFISALRKRNILVTALHNHWLFDKPRMMFIHWQSVENQLKHLNTHWKKVEHEIASSSMSKPTVMPFLMWIGLFSSTAPLSELISSRRRAKKRGILASKMRHSDEAVKI
jgi:hypothetical protein